MIKQEYKRLLKMLEECFEPDKVGLEEILKESVTFFEALRKEFPGSSKDEREEMVQMMTHLHSKLQEISKKTAEIAGMSEEELTAFSEDPSNFSPEQWRTVRETKQKLYDSARKFSSTMEKEKRTEETEDKGSKTPPIRKRTGRAKRKDWTKS